MSGVSGAPADGARGAASPLVSVRGLSVAYRHDSQVVRALNGIDLDIASGERLAVIGESGSGKSTLALAIAGLLPASAVVDGAVSWTPSSNDAALGDVVRPIAPPSVLPDISPSRGEIALASRLSPISNAAGSAKAVKLPISPLEGEMSGRTEGGAKDRGPNAGRGILNPPHPGRDFGFVFQDPAASLDPVMAVGRQVAEVVRTHRRCSWTEAEAAAKNLFQRVRLPDPASAMRAFPHQLSGGQKQRVAIAAAIAAGPRLLIADEATSALDTIVQGEIVALIQQLVREDGMALLFVSHDIALASNLADCIAVFRGGEMVELGPAAEIVAKPRHPYTKSLLNAVVGLEGVMPHAHAGPGVPSLRTDSGVASE